MLWAVMASSVLMIFAVMMSLTPGDSNGEVLNLALPLVAVADVVLSFFIGRVMPRKRQAMLVALAMCESAALLGLVLHVTTGWTYAWTLFALAGAGLVLHFPREA